MHLSHVILRAANNNPQGGGTAFAGRRQTWSEFVDRVSRLAEGLRHAGVRPGDRIAVISQNSDRYCELMFAINWAGGVVQLVNMRLAPAEMVDQIEDSGALFVVTDEAGSLAIAPLRTSLAERQWIGIGEPPGEDIGYNALLEQGCMNEPFAAASDAFALLFYTGGTTGRPKGVMLSNRNLVTCALSQSAALPMGKDDISLHALPMFHVGAISGMMVGIVGGGGHRFLARFDPLTFMQTIVEERVTRTSLGPTMVKMMLDHPSFASFDLSSLRRLHYGSAPISEALLEEVIRKLPDVGLIQGYGQTETSGVVSMLLQPYHRLSGPSGGKLRSAGQSVPGLDLRVVGIDGLVVPQGSTGELEVRGDSVMLGYWQRPEETAEAFHDGWLRTGDMAWFDEDGFLYIADRLKDMIITGGENVFSSEVENALLRHDEVTECAVFGIPSERWGETVHAVVRRAADSTIDEAGLIAHCSMLIARFKCPKSIAFRSEALPLSGVGKTLKTELRAQYLQAQNP